MQSLDGGGAFVGWGGDQPYFTEFDADGRVVFDARFARDDVESYRAYTGPWRATGEGEPRVVARGSTVWASWNGATEVASWRVRPDGGGVVTVPRRHFETAVRLRRPTDTVVVEALDASGAVIGSSGRRPVSG